MKNLPLWGSILAAGALLAVSVLATAQNASAPAGPSTQNPRIALVIGEESYPDKTLATSANDAGLVAQVLQAAGFDVVGARDLDEKSIRTALRDFLTRADAAGPNMQAFVYLAGRAVQYEGDNFFVPVDAQIAHGADVPIEAVRLTDFTHALASAPGVARIVVLDGARANPYARVGLPLAGGLALVEPETGELVAFNASPGSIAPDEAGPYGIYAKTLAGTMRQGGVAIEDIFAQTRLAVNQASGGAQLPWSASKLAAPYFVFERAADAPPPAAPAALAELASRPIKSFSRDEAYAAAVQRDTLPGYQEFLAAYPDSAQARRVRAILAGRREALFWRRSLEQASPHAYWTYLKRYPRGPHAAEAYERLHRLAARAEPPANFAPENYSDLPPPPSDELVYADRPAYFFSGPDYGPPPPRFRVPLRGGRRRLARSAPASAADDERRVAGPRGGDSVIVDRARISRRGPARRSCGTRRAAAANLPRRSPATAPRRSRRADSARSEDTKDACDTCPCHHRDAGPAGEDAATDGLADPERHAEADSHERGRAGSGGEDAPTDALADSERNAEAQHGGRASSAGEDAATDALANAGRDAEADSQDGERAGSAGQDAATHALADANP